MVFSVFLLLKVLLFMNITNIQHYKPIIFLISAMTVLFIYSIIHFSTLRRKNIIQLILYVAISFMMFADVMYYSHFSMLPTVKMLNLIGQVGAVGDSLKELFTLKNGLLILDIPFVIYYAFKIYKNESKDYTRTVRLAVPTALLVILISTLSILKEKNLLGPVTSQEFFTYHIKDMKNTLMGEEKAEGRSLITQEDLEELKERSKLIEGEYTALGKGKNLIVIQVEALQNFAIGLFYEGQEITPNLNKLIEEKGSLYFNNYYQQIGRGNTSDAEFVTNNSLYPSDENSIYEEYANNTFYGLPWILRDNGYTAWVFHGYKKEFWNREKAYVNIGFERFVSEEDYDFTQEESVGFGIVDGVFFNQTLDYMKELDGLNENPFYAFIITLTSHTPFKMPEEYQAIKLKEEHKNTMLGDYLQAVHYADKALGEFIEKLKEEGYYDNSVIAIYGDHFAIKGSDEDEIELMSDFLGKPYHLDQVMNVPLIIHIPGLEENKTIERIGSQLDFLPTILNIMGYENQKGIMFGRDLLNYEGDTFVAPLAYAPKGTFIDEDVIFHMSRDGIFKNSYAIDRKANKLVEDLDPLRDTYEKAIDEINKSNYVLKKNLIKYLMENDGDINLDHLAISDIPYQKKIPKCDDIDQLYRYAQKGKNILSVEVKWDDKEEKVLLKDGTSIEKLIQFMKENMKTYVVLRTSEEDVSLLLKIKDDYKELRDRFIVEMTNFENLAYLTSRAYKHVMLNLMDGQYTKEEVMEFLNRSPLAGVILNGKSYDKTLANMLKDMNVLVYVDNSNNMTILK